MNSKVENTGPSVNLLEIIKTANQKLSPLGKRAFNKIAILGETKSRILDPLNMNGKFFV
jgi:hypothetical protein